MFLSTFTFHSSLRHSPLAASVIISSGKERCVSAARRPAFDIISHSPDQTRAIGAQLGKLLRQGSLVLLSGAIGAGKTTFVQGLARPLRLRAGDQIQSPTFTIVAEHAGTDGDGRPLRLYHVDLYRLDGDGDLDSVGLDDYLADPDGMVVVEWPERGAGWLPEEHLLIELQPVADTKRNLRMTPRGADYVDLTKRFRAEVLGHRG
jgi:tRNA threonylcarbamoyladenosine biosynthesis protein TsaE